MPHETNNPTTPPQQRSLHSASGFGKPTRPPFPEQSQQTGDDAMQALMDRLKDLTEATQRSQ